MSKGFWQGLRMLENCSVVARLLGQLVTTHPAVLLALIWASSTMLEHVTPKVSAAITHQRKSNPFALCQGSGIHCCCFHILAPR